MNVFLVSMGILLLSIVVFLFRACIAFAAIVLSNLPYYALFVERDILIYYIGSHLHISHLTATFVFAATLLASWHIFLLLGALLFFWSAHQYLPAKIKKLFNAGFTPI